MIDGTGQSDRLVCRMMDPHTHTMCLSARCTGSNAEKDDLCTWNP